MPLRWRGEGNPAGHRLTVEDVALIRSMYASEGATQDALALRFGVSQMTISRIVRGRSWRLREAGWLGKLTTTRRRCAAKTLHRRRFSGRVVNASPRKKIRQQRPMTAREVRQEVNLNQAKGGVWASRQTCAVYTAEQVTGFYARFKNTAEVVHFLFRIRQDPKWIARWGSTPLNIVLKSRRPSVAEGGIKPYKVKGKVVYQPWLCLPQNPFGRSVHTVVHEMAHALTAQGRHDARFCRALIYLTRQFEGESYARELKRRLYQTGALKKGRA